MKQASKKARRTIVKCLKEGRVEVRPGCEDAWVALNETIRTKAKSDFTLTDARISECWGPWKKGKRGNDGGFELSWATKSAGFGGFTFVLKDGKIRVDNEYMSRKFLKEVLCRLADEVEMENPEPGSPGGMSPEEK